MKIEIATKNYAVKDYLTELINKKVSKLERYFSNNAVAKVLCKLDGNIYKMELTIFDKGIVYKSETASDNMYENLDTVLPKIERQIVKTIAKKNEKYKKGVEVQDLAFLEVVPKYNPKKIVRRKHIDLVPLSDEEALTNFEMLDNEFYLYLNNETHKVCAMYLRLDGNVGIIETDK